jgi:hypothetical protein
MKLFIDSTFWSAAVTKAKMPAEETPSASGVLRGKPAARQTELLAAISATATKYLMIFS